MKTTFKIIFLAICFLLLFFLFFELVKAEQRGIGINKTVFSFETKNGEERIFNLNVKNLFPTEQEIQIETGSFEILGQNNQINFLPKNSEKSVDDWFYLEENNLKLSANEEKNLSIIIKIPDEVKGGNYQGVLFFKVIPNIEKENSVNENGAIGVQFLINVLTDKKIGSGEIENFNSPLLVGKDLKLDFSFKNTGNFFYIPRGEVRFKNILTGKEEKKVLENHFVFPEQEYNFSVNKKDFFWFGFYRTKLIFIDGNGEFQEKIDYSYGYLFFPLLFIFLIFFIFIAFKFLKHKILIKNSNYKNFDKF